MTTSTTGAKPSDPSLYRNPARCAAGAGEHRLRHRRDVAVADAGPRGRTSACRARWRCRWPTPSRRAAVPTSDVTGVVVPAPGRHRRGGAAADPARRGAETLCRLLGVEAQQRGRRLRAARDRQHPGHLLPQRAGVDDRPGPRAVARRSCSTDMLGAIVSSLRSPRPPGRASWCSCSTPSSTWPASRARSPSSCSRPTAPIDRPARAAGPRGDRRIVMGTVRMGEIEVSSQTGEELVALGLGSCIGLALDRPPSRCGRTGPHRAARGPE